VKRLLFLLIFPGWILAGEAGFYLKLNGGMTFSSPKDEIGQVAVENNKLQPMLQMEVPVFRLKYYTNSAGGNLGIRLAAGAGLDWANFLSNDRSTEINTSITYGRLSVYPLSYNKNIWKFIDDLGYINSFLFDIVIGPVLLVTVNSLHFDYGLASGTLHETDYLGLSDFDEKVRRDMTYTGWGLQPAILSSDSETWNLMAIFDFGRYRWTNGNGNTSSIAYKYIGFGVRYNF